MIIFFAPFEGSSGSLKPMNLFWPKVDFWERMDGMTILASLSTLKKNWTKVPRTVGLCTRGDSGNCKYH